MKQWTLKQGFTLIELLIVVAIIAILAAIAIPNFLEAQTRSKVSRVKSDMRTSTIGLESFHIDHGWYPPDGIWPHNAPWTFAEGELPWVDVQMKPWFTWTQADALLVAGKLNLWRFDNCLFLTTPLAYLTSLPKDPFVEKETWWAGSFNYGQWDNQLKFYQTTSDPDMQPITLDGKIEGYAPIDGRRTFSYSLGSLGPSCWLNSHHDLPMFLQYDPSNGTISKGNILRIGP